MAHPWSPASASTASSQRHQLKFTSQSESYSVGISTDPRGHTVSSHLRVARGWLRTWGAEKGSVSEQGPSCQAVGLCAAWFLGTLGAPQPQPISPPCCGEAQHLALQAMCLLPLWALGMVRASPWQLPELQTWEGGRAPHAEAHIPCLCGEQVNTHLCSSRAAPGRVSAVGRRCPPS